MTKTEINYSRKCVVNCVVIPVKQLLRFVKTKDNQYYFDPEFKISGRGAYVQNDPTTVAKLFEKKLLNRAFKTKINSDVYQKLEEEVAQWTKTKNVNPM